MSDEQHAPAVGAAELQGLVQGGEAGIVTNHAVPVGDVEVGADPDRRTGGQVREGLDAGDLGHAVLDRRQGRIGVEARGLAQRVREGLAVQLRHAVSCARGLSGPSIADGLLGGGLGRGTLAAMPEDSPPPPTPPLVSPPEGAESEGALEAGQPGRKVVIEVKDLVVRYDEQVVLNGVSLTVHEGEVMTIIGGSGSGKSTVLKCILGILTPVSGSVRLLGVDMIHASEKEKEAVYREIGMVYQSGALFGSMTVWENIALPLQQHTQLDPKIIDISVRMKLGQVRLSGFEKRLPSQLSGGQVKRVALARAIAMDPTVLFCDEPSAGLDPRIGRGIDDLIRSLNVAFNMAVVVVTHEMESVKVIADRILMLAPKPGGAQVVFEGTYEELACCADDEVQAFVKRSPLEEPRSEATEVLKQLVGED